MFNNDSVSIKNLIFDVFSEYGQILVSIVQFSSMNDKNKKKVNQY